MRVLLDKSVPFGVKNCLSKHTIDTVAAKGWGTLSNGTLLQAAQPEFDVFVTCDKNIVHQNNMSKLTIAIVEIGTNLWPIIRTDLTPIAQAVDNATPGSYLVVNYPRPLLRRKPYVPPLVP